MCAISMENLSNPGEGDHTNTSNAVVVICMQVASVLLFSMVCIWFLTYRRKQRNFVGPGEWPFLGSSLELVRNFDRFHDWLLVYFKKVKTVNVAMPNSTYTYTVDPVLIEHILKTNFPNYPKGTSFYEKMEVLLGDGIFNSDGEMWKRQRKTASFEFSSKNLRDFSMIVFRQHALILGQIVSGASDNMETIDMQEFFARLTLDSICKVGFGVELGVLSPSLPENPFASAFENANVTVTMRFFDPFWKLKRLFNIGREASLKRSAKIIDDFVYKLIRTRRSEIQASRVCGKSNLKPDLLSRFMELGEDPSNGINDKFLRDIVLNFIIAGRDTTAATLSWFIYMMAMQPDVADKVFEELKQLEDNLKLKHGRNIANAVEYEPSFNESLTKFGESLDYDTLAKLPYLHASLTETLRLYPAVPVDVKGILDDDVAPDGTKLKRGGLVGYAPYCMGRMEFLWGEDAHQFKPERWLQDGNFQVVSPFKFTAFQAGPRVCLGKDSAYLQMKMTAALLCRFFRFELVSPHQVRYRMMTILSMANGLKMTVTKRV